MFSSADTMWVLIAAALVFFMQTGFTVFIVLKAIKSTIGLRVTREEETIGLDIHEHAIESSYVDFMPSYGNGGYSGGGNVISVDKVIYDTDDSVGYGSREGAKLSKIEIFMNPNKFDELKEAMSKIGITGMTVTQVHGCGAQKGRNDYYRGVRLEMKFLPKICIEIVVSKVPVRTVIETAKQILGTGSVGDGKIFVYNIENAVRISTGEEGYDALQYKEA